MARSDNPITRPVDKPADDNLGYWMGKVDAILSDLVSKVGQLTSEITRDLRDLRAWRETVETRLLAGSSRFEEHERRLTNLEKLNVQESRHLNGESDEDEKKLRDERFVSWPWLLERLFAPALGTIIALILGFIFAKLTGAIP